MFDPLSRFRMDGRVAVVTGASSGLGVGFARTLGAAGARLVLVARRAQLLAAVAAELRSEGIEVLEVTADVAEVADCERVADAAVAAFGQIDVLVNNAGVGGAAPALREDPADFARTVGINLTGSYLMARSCAPHMPTGSSVVNVASVLGTRASQQPQAGYVASKHGVVGLTKDLSQQWAARKGIRVNALCPGYFASEITSGEGSQVLRDMVAQHSVLGRFGEQEELDSALLFLASPASSYMTGETLVIDGGLSSTV